LKLHDVELLLVSALEELLRAIRPFPKFKFETDKIGSGASFRHSTLMGHFPTLSMKFPLSNATIGKRGVSITQVARKRNGFWSSITKQAPCWFVAVLWHKNAKNSIWPKTCVLYELAGSLN
jgi:hypothetical protein